MSNTFNIRSLNHSVDKLSNESVSIDLKEKIPIVGKPGTIQLDKSKV